MDIERLKQLKEGSHKVFSEVYDSWDSRVFHYFLKKTNSTTAAQELTQETFIKFWIYRSLIDPMVSIERQLFRKAQQVLIDYLRKKATAGKYINLADPENQATNSHLEETVFLSTETKNSLELAMRALPEKRRKVFELKHLEGLSYKEIAIHMNISTKTVDNHLLKALAQIRKFFALLLLASFNNF